MNERTADEERGNAICKLLAARAKIIEKHPGATPEQLDSIILAAKRRGVKDL